MPWNQKDLFWIVTLVSEELRRKEGELARLQQAETEEEIKIAASCKIAIEELRAILERANREGREVA